MEMISRYIPFLSSPPAPKQTTDSSDDDDPPQTQYPTPPPTIPPLAQFPPQPTNSFARLRSLSRSSAWNVLPPLPSFEQMQLDVVDFWCQAVLLETDPEQSTVYQRNLVAALRVLPMTSSPNHRAEARLILASRAKELVLWQLGQVGSSSNTKGVSTYKFTADDWKRIQDEWNEMRKAVVLARPDHEQDNLLQGDFRAVGRLLHYQRILAVFRWSLHKDNPTSLQEAIEMLENGWNGGDFLLEDAEEELAPEQTMVPSRIQTILEPVKKRRPNINECLQRCRDLLWGDESNEFSHAHLQHAMHALIIRWSESILGIPTLFHLRYAGVAPYTVQDPENDDVSSFGDEQETKGRREQENRMFHARFEDPVAAMANTVADPEVVESEQPAVDLGEAAKQAAKSIDDNILKESTLEDEEDDYPETQLPVETQKVRIQQERFVASKRALLSTGYAEPPRPYTQSQESEMQGLDSGVENNQERVEKRKKHSNPPNRATEPRIVDENVQVQREVQRERKRDSLMDSSEDEEKPKVPKKQKRTKFTCDEEDAIREGVKRFGVGNWKYIKDNDSRLDGRTTVQIKDKYRTMLQKG